MGFCLLERFLTNCAREKNSESPRGFLPRPLLRAGNSAEVLPNQNPQKIVWQNRVRF